MSDDPTPDAPATIELGEDEIEALKFDERQRRPAQKPKRLPSTVEAVIAMGRRARRLNRTGEWTTWWVDDARALSRPSDLAHTLRLVRQPPRGGRRL